MGMSLNQYVLNPALKSNAILNATARELIKRNYEKKFDNILLRENGKINYWLFSEKEKSIFWVYIKIPSEVVTKFYYDVVLRFVPDINTGYTDDLFKYNVEFFSNDPNFVYTYAYVFNKNGMLIKELQSKLPKEALTKTPEEKNPTEQIGYEKAIYFAYLVMKDRKLNKPIRFNVEAKPLDPKFLLKEIEKAEDKIQARQEEGKRYSGKKRAIISSNVAKAALSQIDSKTRKNLDLSKSNVKIATTTKTTSSVKRGNKFTKTTPKK